MDGKLARFVAVAMVVVLMLPVIYAGAYLALVERPRLADPYFPKSARYRLGGEFSETFFAPLNSMDRQLRPSYWE